jgi:hypothetical protein
MKVRELIDILRNEEPNKEVIIEYEDCEWGKMYGRLDGARADTAKFWKTVKANYEYYLAYDPYDKYNYHPPETHEVVILRAE